MNAGKSKVCFQYFLKVLHEKGKHDDKLIENKIRMIGLDCHKEGLEGYRQHSSF